MFTVYSPGWFIVTTCVLFGGTIPGPDQVYVAAPDGAVNVVFCPPHTVGVDDKICSGWQSASR